MKLPVQSTVGLLLSGGIDSSVLASVLLAAGNRVQPFYVKTDLYWQPEELAAANQFLAAIATPQLLPLVQFDLPLRDLYRNHWSVSGQQTPNYASRDAAVFLPGRNALLLVKAAIWCQIEGIESLALAPLGSSPFADASEAFFQSFAAAINCGDLPPLQIWRPFDVLTKTDIMELGRQLPLKYTFSCIAPCDGLHCGACNKCAERQAAFTAIQLFDPTRYAVASSSDATKLANSALTVNIHNPHRSA